MKKLILLFGLSLSLLSCTDNSRARNFGGTEIVDLPKNCKFINSTWKEDQLWIVVQDTITKENFMYEKSSWGVLEGRIIFK
jgi:hypothetical protein